MRSSSGTSKNRSVQVNGQLAVSEVQQLEIENDILLQIIHSTPAAVISATPDGLIQTWNKGAENIYGYTSDEILGKSLSALFPQDGLEELVYILESVRRDCAIGPIDSVRMKKDGSQVAVSVSVSPLHDKMGRVMGLASIAHDISRLKLAESEKLRLQEIVERTSDFIGMCTDDEHVTYINPAGRVMVGIGVNEDITHLSIYELMPDWSGELVGL